MDLAIIESWKLVFMPMTIREVGSMARLCCTFKRLASEELFRRLKCSVIEPLKNDSYDMIRYAMVCGEALCDLRELFSQIDRQSFERALAWEHPRVRRDLLIYTFDLWIEKPRYDGLLNRVIKFYQFLSSCLAKHCGHHSKECPEFLDLFSDSSSCCSFILQSNVKQVHIWKGYEGIRRRMFEIQVRAQVGESRAYRQSARCLQCMLEQRDRRRSCSMVHLKGASISWLDCSSRTIRIAWYERKDEMDSAWNQFMLDEEGTLYGTRGESTSHACRLKALLQEMEHNIPAFLVRQCHLRGVCALCGWIEFSGDSINHLLFFGMDAICLEVAKRCGLVQYPPGVHNLVKVIIQDISIVRKRKRSTTSL